MGIRAKRIKIFAFVFAGLVVLNIFAVFGIDLYVKKEGSDRIITSKQAAELTDIDCIVVLGCQVHSDGTPSDMLADRIKRGVELYGLSASPKLLMSGDHGQDGYDEVSAMKRVAVESGVPSEDVFLDHAGFSTYESIYRAKEIFGANKIIVVTQQYHLIRALYIAEKLGIDAYGVACDYRTYSGQTMRDIREIVARDKDFFSTVFKAKPTFLGEKISLSDNGDITNNKPK